MLPFCTVGGLAIAMKKGDLSGEVDEGRRAIGQVGGRVEGLVRVPILAGLSSDRVLVVCRKVRATRADLPRAAGIPAKRPL
jgi:16S rRNA (guanine527-N7)-methyltransferase